MVRIRLSNREFRLLNLCQQNLKLNYSIDDYELQINNKEEIEMIINSINDYFVRKGLKRNEPNSLGLELENLNDRFIILLQELEA